MDRTIIAVSKRCCPVCWELLDILRGHSKRFHVRGCHITLFPVELPSWFSEDHVDEMISRFKQIVQDELVDMMVYVRTPSRPSDVDSTTGSHVDHRERMPGAGSFEFIPAGKSSSTHQL
jgi:hypothetical protein